MGFHHVSAPLISLLIFFVVIVVVVFVGAVWLVFLWRLPRAGSCGEVEVVVRIALGTPTLYPLKLVVVVIVIVLHIGGIRALGHRQVHIGGTRALGHRQVHIGEIRALRYRHVHVGQPLALVGRRVERRAPRFARAV